MAEITPTVAIVAASDAAKTSLAAQDSATKTAAEILKDIESYITTAAKQGRTNVSYAILKWKISDEALVEVCDTLTYYNYQWDTLDSGEYGIINIDWNSNRK